MKVIHPGDERMDKCWVGVLVKCPKCGRIVELDHRCSQKSKGWAQRMKIITPGDEQIGKWWVGERASCERCGRTVEFERDDFLLPCWIPYPTKPDVICVECENCGWTIEAQIKCPPYKSRRLPLVNAPNHIEARRRMISEILRRQQAHADVFTGTDPVANADALSDCGWLCLIAVPWLLEQIGEK